MTRRLTRGAVRLCLGVCLCVRLPSSTAWPLFRAEADVRATNQHLDGRHDAEPPLPSRYHIVPILPRMSEAEPDSTAQTRAFLAWVQAVGVECGSVEELADGRALFQVLADV